MTWYAIFETASGRLESIGERDDALRTARLESVALDAAPDLSSVMWDETTRDFVARPAKVLVDRLDDIQSHPDASDFLTAFNSLNAANRTRVRNFLIWLLNRYRYRNQSESLRLE